MLDIVDVESPRWNPQRRYLTSCSTLSWHPRRSCAALTCCASARHLATVAELLRSIVPLLNDQGLVADWHVISGTEPFFQVTKAIRDKLGPTCTFSDAGPGALSRHLAQHHQLGADYDFVFVHNPQPAAMFDSRARGGRARMAVAHRHGQRRTPTYWSLPASVPGRVRRSIFTDGRIRAQGSAHARRRGHPRP